MNRFLNYLQRELGYSNYQIQLIKYFFKALLCESSKFILMGIFFYTIDFLLEYLIAIMVLMTVRTSLGGLHFKTYAGCFAFTVVFLILCVLYLPTININKVFMLIALLLCIIITNYIGPITSCYRRTPTGIMIKNSKRNASISIFFYCLLIFIIPSNQYLTIGFWVIIAQTFQLSIAFITNKRRW